MFPDLAREYREKMAAAEQEQQQAAEESPLSVPPVVVPVARLNQNTQLNNATPVASSLVKFECSRWSW